MQPRSLNSPFCANVQPNAVSCTLRELLRHDAAYAEGVLNPEATCAGCSELQHSDGTCAKRANPIPGRRAGTEPGVKVLVSFCKRQFTGVNCHLVEFRDPVKA